MLSHISEIGSEDIEATSPDDNLVMEVMILNILALDSLMVLGVRLHNSQKISIA